MRIRGQRFTRNWQSLASIIIFAGTILVGVSRASGEVSPGKDVATGQAAKSANTPISIAVDATEAPRKILHARLSIPASPGPLRLMYPKWIPGEHGPTGPIELLVENGEMVKSCRLDYHGGERFPHLERDASKPDLLEKIIHPLTH